MDAEPLATVTRALGKSVAIAVVLLTMHATFFLGLALIVAGVAVVTLALGCLWPLATRNWQVLKLRSSKLGIYCVLFASCFASGRVYLAVADERADTLLKGILAFERQHGQYPESLDALVPEFLPAIPEVLPAPLFPRRFSYRKDRETFNLAYVTLGMNGKYYDHELERFKVRD